ncbi:MAG: hypothetical protein AAFO72_11195 [Pseudomonadota bacterium]
MPMRNRFAWSSQSCEDQLQMAYSASRDDLRMMARAFDWSTDHEAVISWIMANKSIDLASALTVFFNGDPARFNYMPKRHISQEFLAETSLLDNICLRINSGFYRTSKVVRIEDPNRLEKWLFFQSADRKEGRRGRWLLDETIVQNAIAPSPQIRDGSGVEQLRVDHIVGHDYVHGRVTSAIGRCLSGFVSDIVQNRRAG